MKFLTFTRNSALFSWLLLSGCNQILDIQVQKVKERDDNDGGVVEDDAGQDGGEIVYENPSEDECTEYCDLLDQVCSPTSPNAAFKESSYCRGLCGYMQRTPDEVKKGNTFDCRLQQAMSARSAGVGDNADECKSAGAGGNSTTPTNGCGSNCEGYCQLYAAVCMDYPALQRGESCLSECAALATDPMKSAAAAFSSNADTLQCRLAHLGAAAVDPITAMNHCPHAAIIAASGTPCQPTAPSCDHYCALVMNTCKDKMAQYDSLDDCVATCRSGLTLTEPLAAGETSDQTHDTVACRRYHTYNALQNPGATHCQHAGPSGDGHCGRICPAYCKLAKAACGTMFSSKFPKGEQDCLAECASPSLVGTSVLSEQLDQNYNLPNAQKRGTINCRIYHATKAFLAPSECPSVFGEEDCKP